MRVRSALLGMLWLALAVAGAVYAQADLPERIEIFVTDATPVEIGAVGRALLERGQLQIHNLDDRRRFERSISLGLPADPQQATAIARERLERYGPQLQTDAMQAWAGAAQLHRYQVTQLPAIVFDSGAAAVVGVYRLDEALIEYRHWRSRRDREQAR